MVAKRKMAFMRGPRKARKSKAWSSAGGGEPVPRNITFGTGDRNIARITRTVEKVALNTAAGGTFLGALQFALSDLSASTDFNLYDEYRIRFVKLTLTNQQSVSMISTVSYPLPVLHTCIDTDDATTPGSINVVFNHDTCTTHGSTNKSFVRWVKPYMSLAAYQGAFTGFGQRKDQWINTGSPGVTHYGLKYALEAAPALGIATGNIFYIHATYYMEFRKAF